MPSVSPKPTKKSLHFWLRDEVKELEKRTPLLPIRAKQLIDSGHRVTVEKSNERCVQDVEYEEVGCTMVEAGTWPNAPADAIILGLKELPESNEPLTHTHVFFAHCYKNQDGWEDILGRFKRGNGKLLDLEFLVDDNGRRVAAFGRSAGFIGMALGIMGWCEQQLTGQKLGSVDYYADSEALLQDARSRLAKVLEKTGKSPTIMIMGALGRSGTGAKQFAEGVGIPSDHITKWDLAETAKGGPFQEVIQHDIFVNCIYLSSPIPPFVTREMLSDPSRKMSVVVDVSCDPSNPNNPVRIYNGLSNFKKPAIRTMDARENLPPVDVVAIDHLPSLVPLESSMEFSGQLISHLIECGNSDVWHRAEALYRDKSKLIS